MEHTTQNTTAAPADGEQRSEETATRRAWLRAITSLQCKATVLVSILTLAVTGAVAGYLLRYSSHLVNSEQESHAVLAATLFADAVAPALERTDLASLQSIAERTVNHNPLLFVTIADTDRNVVLRLRSSRMSGTPEEEFETSTIIDRPGVQIIPTEVADGNVLSVIYPVSKRGDISGDEAGRGIGLLGYVQVVMATDRWARSMTSRLDLLAGVAMIAVVVVVPLGFSVVRRIIAPLEQLASLMNRFASGDLGVQTNIDRNDEIGRLGSAFNRMATEHRRVHSGLLSLNAELEDRVASRTRQLREIASREPLTGLYNRRHFSEVLNRRFAEAQRYDTDLSCIMIDLDGFKSMNDGFGHHVGDELLVLAAATILSQLRTADVAARYGGDEFILLLPQTSAQRASVLADRVVQKFARDANARFPDGSVSMSAGVASLRDSIARDGEALVRAADRAMYRAKADGKNRIVCAAATLPAGVD